MIFRFGNIFVKCKATWQLSKNFYIFRSDDNNQWTVEKDLSVLARTETRDLFRSFWQFKPQLKQTNITKKQMFKLILDNINLHSMTT